jgi:tetratricopeptide (TPR) repeat protein
LAGVVAHQQKFLEAQHLYQEALTRQMRDTGTEDFTVLGELAEVYRLAKDYSKAEETNQRALQLELGSQEPGSGFILGTIERLGTVYEEQGKYVQEETLYRNAAESSQALLPRGDLTIIAHLNDLGLFYERRERFQEAETYYGRALDQFVGLSNDGLKDSNLDIVTRNYARLLRLMGRVAEAEQYEAKVK